MLVADARSLGAAVPNNTTPVVKNPPPPLASSATPIFTVPNGGDAYSPTWSRDGRELGLLALQALQADGTTLTLFDVAKRTTKPLIRDAVSPPAIARDTTLLAVLRKSTSGRLQALIRYVNGQVFNPPIQLPFHTAPANFPPLAFITNTANVIVAGGDGGKTDLYLLDQTEVVQLTTTGDILGFGVSADGSRVRWVRASPNTKYILLQIYELAIDTRSLKKLPYPDRIPAINPNPRSAPTSLGSVVFSPDLNRFAFVTHGGPQAAPNGSALWISDVTGTEVHFVGTGTSTNTLPPAIAVPASALQITGQTFPYYAPAFSPDSQSLAAVRNENGKRYLWVGSAATGQGKGTPLP